MGNYGEVPNIKAGPCGPVQIAKPGDAAYYPKVLSELDVLAETLDRIGKVSMELEERLGVLLTPPSECSGCGRPMGAESALTRQIWEMNNKALNIVEYLTDLRRRVDL
jgi:hypothetical protein